MSGPPRPRVTIATRAEQLAGVAERCARAEAIAVDVEANGLHAFRPRLCTVQLAWPEGDDVHVAIVDALALRVDTLAPAFGERGPVKVLHDLTYDARLLAESGAPLARVRDTSVAARLLGFKATGLAAVALSELGVVLEKRFQQHDWSRRPLEAEHLAYLAGDVAHLLAIDAQLAARAAAQDIADEIAEECAHKLASALAPPRDARPAYARIKGAPALDRVGRAVLRRLVEARDRIADSLDVPAFKVVGNDLLLELARLRPTSEPALRSLRVSGIGAAARHATALVGAIRRGLEDGDVPEEDRAAFERPRVDRAAIALRRARETQLSAWRRDEARRRGVDEQAVLPGHCAQELVQLFVACDAADPDLAARIAAIPGLGAKRFARYEAALLTLARTPPTLEPPPSSDRPSDRDPIDSGRGEG